MVEKRIFGNEDLLSGWFLALGILSLFFGFVFIVAPIQGSVTAELLFGILLLVFGICEVAFAFLARGWTGFLFLLLGGLLSLAVALMLLLRPAGAIVALTFLLGVYLLVRSLLNLLRALRMKQSKHWEWLLFDALVGILLGVLILIGWPSDSLWVLGTLFGINMLFGGVSLILLSQGMRRDQP